MTYTEYGDEITLQMSRDDFDCLMLVLGHMAGAAQRAGDAMSCWRWIDFANRLNATNPNFRQYEIPEEFRRRNT